MKNVTAASSHSLRGTVLLSVVIILATCRLGVAQTDTSADFPSLPTQLWSPTAEVPAQGKTNRKLKPLDDLFTSFLKENQLPGVTVAVTYKKRLIYQRGFGYSDLASKVEMEADALMRIASLSKPITGVAIMRLVNQGKLDLDQKVFELLNIDPMNPEKVDSRSADITIRHLMHHTAGYDRDASFDPMFRNFTISKVLGKGEPPIEKHDIVRYMLSKPLDFTPGEKFAYSNYGYCLLGLVIEKVTGDSYSNYVTEEILKPVGIKRMRIGLGPLKDRAEGEVRYHMRKQIFVDACVGDNVGVKVPRQYGGFNLRNMDSHGAWIASAADLVKFASQLDRPKRCKWMDAESVMELFAMPDYLGLKKAKGKSLRYYSAGWKIFDGTKGKNAFHGGSLSGTSTTLVRRYDQVNWAILFNSRKTPDGKDAAKKIDSAMHKAVNAVKKNYRFK